MRRYFVRLVATGLSLCCAQPALSTGCVEVHAERLRAIFTGDVRVLWAGDSFSAPSGARISMEMLRTWPVQSWTAVEAAYGGGWLSTLDDTGGNVIVVSAGNSYRLLTATVSTNIPRYALPIWKLREVFGDANLTLGSQGSVVRYRFANNFLAQGENGRFTQAGDMLAARFLYFDPPAPGAMPGSVTVTDGGVNQLVFNPATQSRPHRVLGGNPATDPPTASVDGQINAAPADIGYGVGLSGDSFLHVRLDPSFIGSTDYFHPAGAVLYHVDTQGARRPGLYWSVLADSSWAYEDYSRNIEAGAPGAPADQKTFSRTQLAHWLDVTTLDPGQPLYVLYLMDAQPEGSALAKSLFEAMIDQTEAAAADAGILQVVHGLVIPHMHRIGSLSDADARTIFMGLRDAAFAVAAERSNVAAISLFDATDGVFFNGSQVARDWLVANGFGVFQYGSIVADLAGATGENGNLLDGGMLHPRDSNSAAFFSRIISNVIASSGCAADISGNGIVGGEDLASVLSAWGTSDTISDLNCDGVVNGGDLTVVLNAWGACP